MSSLAAATLARSGVAEIVVANRTFERAERLAQILVRGRRHGRAGPRGTDGLGAGRADTCRRGRLLHRCDRTRPHGRLRAATLAGRTGAPAVESAAAADAAAAAGSVGVREGGRVRRRHCRARTAVGGDETAPWTCPPCPSGFSVMGEAAVAGVDAATLEQHGAWAAGGTAVDRPRETGRTGARRRPS